MDRSHTPPRDVVQAMARSAGSIDTCRASRLVYAAATKWNSDEARTAPLTRAVRPVSGLLPGARRRSARPTRATSPSRSGADLAFVPMLVGFAVDEPPHVEMGRRVVLSRIA